MSTKIYNGRKVLVHHGLRDIHRWSIGLRNLLAPVRLAEFKSFAPSKEEQRWWRHVWMSKPAERALRAMPDFGASIVWLPHRSNEQLLLPFFYQDAYMKLLDGLPDVREYAYWNNADEPEGMTELEWETRKSVWNQALPGAGVPSECGLAIELLPAGIPSGHEMLTLNT